MANFSFCQGEIKMDKTLVARIVFAFSGEVKILLNQTMCLKLCPQTKKQSHIFLCNCLILKWAQLGSNQRPTDYESATLTN